MMTTQQVQLAITAPNTKARALRPLFMGVILFTLTFYGYVRAAAAQGTKTQQNSGYNNVFNYQAGVVSGAYSNSGTVNGRYSSLAGDTGPLVGLDCYVDGLCSGGPTPSGNYEYGLGLLAWNPNIGSNGTTTITNNAGGTIEGVMSGSGEGQAAGIYSLQYYGSAGGTDITINNYGDVSGTVENYDGTAAGIYHYSLYGGLTLNNYANATSSATARYYTTGIYGMSYFGPISVVNNGAAEATSSGGEQGATNGYAYAVGIDMFTYDGGSAAPLSVQNTGTVTATTTGGTTQNAYAMFIWSEGGAMSLNNSGNVTATSTSASGAAAHTIYCGGNNGPVTFVNSGAITGTAGGAGGWGVGIENDGSETVVATNSGSISHNNGLGLALFAGSGNATINNTGSISGGLTGISAPNYPGNVTINDSGSITSNGDAIALGSGTNTVNLSGLPVITGTMVGGSGSNTLNFNLTGTLQKVNGATATLGGNLSAYGLGASGSIVVSGKTYSWSNFNVRGTIGTTLANGTYMITNVNSGLALEDPAFSGTDGEDMDQWTVNGGSNQLWTLTNLGGGAIELTNVASGQSLDVTGGSKANSVLVDQWPYHDVPWEQWTPTAISNGSYELTSVNSGLALDVAYWSKSSGAQIDQYPYYSAAGQQWIFSLK